MIKLQVASFFAILRFLLFPRTFMLFVTCSILPPFVTGQLRDMSSESVKENASVVDSSLTECKHDVGNSDDPGSYIVCFFVTYI